MNFQTGVKGLLIEMPLPKRVLLMTKLVVLFTLVAVFQATANSYAQRITLKAQRITLSKAMEAVHQQSGYEVFFGGTKYGRALLNVDMKNATLEEAMTALLHDLSLDWRLSGNTIIIKPSTERRSAKEVVHTPQVEQREVTGRVIDETGNPLSGATVTVKGTLVAATTDDAGVYRITVLSDGGSLVFTMVGFEAQEHSVNDQSIINVAMKASVSDLEEVVVVGYGTAKKGDLTGSITRLDAEDFESQPMTQLSDMLTGTVAGFNANQMPGSAGGSSMEIRGRKSLSAGTNPLLVVDGAIFNGSISDINPADIESIDILKDASSAAVYGARAASGVVIVTTKRGLVGKPVISFSADLGLTGLTNSKVKPLSGDEYTTFRRDWLIRLHPNQPDYYFHNPMTLPSDISIEDWYSYNQNPNEDVTTEWLNRLLFFPTEITTYLNGNEENWYERVIRKGLRQDYDLSINGGTEHVSYYWSLGYTDNEGVVVGDEYATFRSRLNINAKIAEFLDIGVNAQFASQNNSAVAADINQMLISSPFSSMLEEDGSLKWYPNDYIGFQNPLINHLQQDKLAKANSIFTSIYTDLKLPYGFRYRLSFQPRFSYENDYNFWPSTTPVGFDVQGRGTRQDSRVYEWMVDNLLKWNREFGKHTLDFTFLYNLEKFQSWSSYQRGESFAPNENLSYNALQFAKNYLITNTDDYSTGDAMMARLNYIFNDKYLFTLSLRRDGYSAFGQGNPRALFPAGAFAWKISNEDFFKSDVLSTLKLRLSWGVNGNREIGRYAALARLSQNLYSDGSSVLVGVYNNSLANPNLAWERSEALNIGVDFGLWKERISGNLDVYHMTTMDLLMERVLPKITGFEYITTNLGQLQNRGLEFTLKSINVDNSTFKWKSDLVFSLNRNKIVSLFGDYEEIVVDGETIRQEVSDISNEWFINQSVDRIWDYNITGVWQTDQAEEAKKYGLLPGDYRAEDVNNDGVYSELNDKQFIGWREPRYRLGVRNTFKFNEHISASIFIRADLGHMGSVAAFTHSRSAYYDRLGMRSVPYWTEENPSNKYGSLTASSAAYGGGYNVYFDRSFVRIQDLSLSYQIPDALFQKLKLQSLLLSASVRNLVSFNKWEDWDPESDSDPMPRIFSIGIKTSL